MHIDHSTDKQAIGLRLQQLRLKGGYSEAAFGELCGHTATDVKSWESGRAYPSIPILSCLASHQIDVFYVLTGHVGPKTYQETTLVADFQNCDEITQKHLVSIAQTGAVKQLADTHAFLTQSSDMSPTPPAVDIDLVADYRGTRK